MVKRCVFCGSKSWKMNRADTPPWTTQLFAVSCGACGLRGPWAESEKDAISIWNNLILQMLTGPVLVERKRENNTYSER